MATFSTRKNLGVATFGPCRVPPHLAWTFPNEKTPHEGGICGRRGGLLVDCELTIGINAHSADWLPNDDPPAIQERIAWIWFVRPDLAPELLPLATDDLANLIACYAEDRMDDWWSEMAGP